MSLANVFKSNLFKTTSLTLAINADEQPPQRIAELGLFESGGVRTTSIVIERRGSTLDIIPAKARGAPPTPMKDGTRDAISFEIPHFPAIDTLLADELQDVRAFGSEDQLQGVEMIRDEKLGRMNASIDATEEYHRLGAIQGLVLDANGDVLFDLYDEFGVTEPDAIYLDLAAAWAETDGGVIRGKLGLIKDQMRRALKNRRVRGVWAPCGEGFFNDLINHPEIRQTYMNQQAANDLRDGEVDDRFTYGGVLFEKYPGYGDVEMPDDECRFVPMGVPGLFISRYAPAPWFSAVNRIGLPRYAMATLDPTGEKMITMEAQTNGIHLLTQPEVSIPGKAGVDPG